MSHVFRDFLSLSDSKSQNMPINEVEWKFQIKSYDRIMKCNDFNDPWSILCLLLHVSPPLPG